MKKAIVWLLILAALLSGCSRVEKPEDQDRADQSENQLGTGYPQDQGLQDAPDFTVYDSSGKAVKLSDFAGKGVVLNFWATWCPPCKAELPDFQEQYNRCGDEVHFLFVNLTDGQYETVATVNGFMEAMGYTFPVYFDLDYDASDTYGVSAIPTTYFINARGKIVSQSRGMIDADALRRGIDSILE